MRRQEIIEGVLQVVSAIRESNIFEALDAARHGAKEAQIGKGIFSSYKRYILAAQSYNYAAREVASILGLDALEEPATWSEFSQTDTTLPLRRAAIFATEFLPKLVTLLTPEALSPRQKTTKEKSKLASLTLVLPEGPGEHSKPQRLADGLQAVEMIYEGVALLEGEPENTLSVVACDSGSDKSFDFLGVAKVIETVREILLAVWDRVVFYRELQVQQRLELVASSLPILEKISKLEQEQSIGREQAEMVRRKVIEGVGQFLVCGAVIPEMTERSHFEPRDLMASEPKLLSAGIPEETPPDGDLTEEEKKLLEQLEQKRRRRPRDM